jgi:hypothetical protein
VLLDRELLVSRAHEVYQSRSALRQKIAIIEETIHSQHPIELPEGILSRAEAVYSQEAWNRLAKFKALMSGQILTKVAPNSTSDTGKRQRDRLEAWMHAKLEKFRTELIDLTPQGDGLCEDMGVWSQGYVRIMPDFQAYTTQRSSDLHLVDDSFETVDDFTERVNEALLHLDEVAAREQSYRESHDPIQMQWVPARSCFPDLAGKGLGEFLEIQRMPVRQCLTTFVDADGDPLATELARSFNYTGQDQPLWRWGGPSHGFIEATDDDQVCVVIRTDTVHMQIGVIHVTLDEEPGSDYRRNANGIDEVIWEGEHGLGRVPYVFFRGRMTNHQADVHRYKGWLDPVVGLVRSLDNALSQLATIIRTTAWPVLAVTRKEMMSGYASSEKPLALPVIEGQIYNGLQVGEDIKPIVWGTENQQRAAQALIEWYYKQIDALTVGRPSAGEPAGASGFLYGLQIAQDQSGLRPFEIGFETGYADCAQLILCCVRVLHAAGIGPIPLRYQGPRGMETVALDEKISGQEWQITCVLGPDKGGEREFALTQTMRAQMEMGIATPEMALERLGYRYPHQILEEVAKWRFGQAQEVTQATNALIVARIQELLSAPEVEPLPAQPVIDPGLAAVLQQHAANPLVADIIARLPRQGLPTSGVQGANGLGTPPNPLTGAGVPGLPNMLLQGPSDGTPPAPGTGGSPTGQAMAAPGGMMRQDQLAGAGVFGQ